MLAATATAQSSTAAQPGELDGLDYVALGDSYSAGFGLEPYSTTTPFSGDPNGCYQSQNDYPSRVAASLGLDITDQTCSGAITANVGYPAGVTFPALTPAEPLPVLPTGDELQVTLAGLTVPELQKAGLDESTDVVTVGIGGNDLGFSHIAEACIRTGVDPTSEPVYLALELGISVPNCADYFGDPTTYPAADLFTRMTDVVAPRIDGVLDAIATLAPNAQVFVVGYPMVTPADATNACFTAPTTPNSVPFSGTDLQFIHSVEIALDGALQSGAEEHGFHFVTSWASSANNTLCSTDPWIWGLTAYENDQPTCDANYLPVLNGEICVELGALHPTENGIANLASLTTAAVNSAFFVTPASASVAVGDSLGVTGGGFQPGEDRAHPTRLGLDGHRNRHGDRGCLGQLHRVRHHPGRVTHRRGHRAGRGRRVTTRLQLAPARGARTGRDGHGCHTSRVGRGAPASCGGNRPGHGSAPSTPIALGTPHPITSQHAPRILGVIARAREPACCRGGGTNIHRRRAR